MDFFRRRIGRKVMACPTQLVNSPTPALAVIDGTLCQLTRKGTRAAGHAPLATAVLEFRHGTMRYYVREHPHGLLPGISNLYCLDGAFRLQWMAEWPDASDPCTAIVGEEGDCLVAESASGTIVRLDAHSGRLLRVEQRLADAM
jgi:hypothetical protein